MSPLTTSEAWTQVLEAGKNLSLEDVDDSVRMFRGLVERLAPIISVLWPKYGLVIRMVDLLVASLYDVVRPELKPLLGGEENEGRGPAAAGS